MASRLSREVRSPGRLDPGGGLNPSKNHGKSRKIPQIIPQTLINESLKRSQERQVTKKRCSQAVIDPRDLVILVRGAIWNAKDQTRAYGTALASRSSREVRVPGWLDSSSGITVVAEYPHGKSNLKGNGRMKKQSKSVWFRKGATEKSTPFKTAFAPFWARKKMLSSIVGN